MCICGNTSQPIRLHTQCVPLLNQSDCILNVCHFSTNQIAYSMCVTSQPIKLHTQWVSLLNQSDCWLNMSVTYITFETCYDPFFPCKIDINTMRPSDAIWCYRTGSTLVPVMTCCLKASGHNLNQCWLLLSTWHVHIYCSGIVFKIWKFSLKKIIWKFCLQNVGHFSDAILRLKKWLVFCRQNFKLKYILLNKIF